MEEISNHTVASVRGSCSQDSTGSHMWALHRPMPNRSSVFVADSHYADISECTLGSTPIVPAGRFSGVQLDK